MADQRTDAEHEAQVPLTVADLKLLAALLDNRARKLRRSYERRSHIRQRVLAEREAAGLSARDADAFRIEKTEQLRDRLNAELRKLPNWNTHAPEADDAD